MGKQSGSRRDWREEQHERVVNGAKNVPAASRPGNPASVATMAPKPDNPAPAQKDTVATKSVYDLFFELYAGVVSDGGNGCSLADGCSGKRNGIYFLPLGFIPGPAVVLEFRRGTPVVVDATPDVGKVGALDDKTIDRIKQAMDTWMALVEGIGSEPSPWNFGFARGLLDKRIPPKYLTMGMTRFRLGPGDREVAFGVTLVPAGNNDMKVENIYNPTGMAGVPAEGEVLTLATLKEGRGPVQKLLRTWALMESNYAGRFNRQGEARERQPYHDRHDDRDRHDHEER